MPDPEVPESVEPMPEPTPEVPVEPTPEPTSVEPVLPPADAGDACKYCGVIGGKHAGGCPVALGTEGDCVPGVCPGCTFHKRTCAGK